jgi:hypothetical protein
MKFAPLRFTLLSVVLVTIDAGLTARLQGDTQGGEAVRVDFQAVGAEGQPISDLKADEVTIRVGGRARVVKELTFVQVAAGGTGPAPSVIPAPFGVNSGDTAASRQVALIVEDETLPSGGEKMLRDAVGAFLDKLGPADQVALAIAPRDSAQLGFSTGRDRVREVLAKLQGRAKAAVSAAESTCRTRDTLALLHGRLSSMSGAEAPTTVLFFSSSLSTPSVGQQRSSAAGQCEIDIQMFREISSAMAPARAQLYVVQHDPTLTAPNEGLQNLVGATGSGQVLRLADPSGSLTRVLAETSAHYVATLEPDASDKSNQAQRLEVRVTRTGVTTRSRLELASAAARPAGKPSGLSPQQMVREQRAFPDLPLRVVGYASRGAAGRMTVIALGESADPAAKIKAATVALIDPSGKIAAQATAGEKELAQSPMLIATAVAPGSYRLRLAAVDAAGRSGAADYPLAADFTAAGPLKLGSLMIGALRNNSMAMALQFRDDEKLVGYLEMYGQITAQVKARMEVATSVEGPAIVTVQPGGSGTSEPDKFILTGEIPIASLAPGDYVVRAVVSMADQPEGKVMKTFRKVAR